MGPGASITSITPCVPPTSPPCAPKRRAILAATVPTPATSWAAASLTPEQQRDILTIFQRYGYTEETQFDHYVDVVDF